MNGFGASAPSDIPINSCPSDTITALDWSPQAEVLTAGCWDGLVYVWSVQPNGQSAAVTSFTHQAPVLCTRFHSDGAKIFSGGCDSKVTMWDLNTGQQQVVAQHSAPVRECRWIEEKQFLVTASWDKTIRYWDLRQPQPTHTTNLPERCLCMDAVFPYMVVGCAERIIMTYELRQGQLMEQTLSKLKFQTRSLACFSDAKGYAMASIEARVAVNNFLPQDQKKDFVFSIEKKNPQGLPRQHIPCNSIRFFKNSDKFVTGSSDGSIIFWAKDTTERLKELPKVPLPVTNLALNRTSSILAYAASYDFSQGPMQNPPNSQILLHNINLRR